MLRMQAQYCPCFPDLEHYSPAIPVQHRRVLRVDLVIVLVALPLHGHQRCGLSEMGVEYFRHFVPGVSEAGARRDDRCRRYGGQEQDQQLAPNGALTGSRHVRLVAILTLRRGWSLRHRLRASAAGGGHALRPHCFRFLAPAVQPLLELLARQHAVRIEHQLLQQREFSWLQVDAMTVARYGARCRIKDQRPDAQERRGLALHRRTRARNLAASSSRSVVSRVVVGAAVEPGNRRSWTASRAVRTMTGTLLPRARYCAGREAAQARQPQIEDDRGETFDSHRGLRSRPSCTQSASNPRCSSPTARASPSSGSSSTTSTRGCVSFTPRRSPASTARTH